MNLDKECMKMLCLLNEQHFLPDMLTLSGISTETLVCIEITGLVVRKRNFFGKVVFSLTSFGRHFVARLLAIIIESMLLDGEDIYDCMVREATVANFRPRRNFEFSVSV
jgi:hypothetical protein